MNIKKKIEQGVYKMTNKQYKQDLYYSSHGGTDFHSGELELLSALAINSDNNLVVVIGSGGGLIPKLFKDCQRMYNQCGITILIDAFKEAFPSNGKPNYNESIDGYEDIEIIKDYGINCINKFKNNSINILYEDSDHQIETAINHFEGYYSKMCNNSYFIVHDIFNKNQYCTVRQFPDYIKQTQQYINGQIEIMNFNIGEGFSVVHIL